MDQTNQAGKKSAAGIVGIVIAIIVVALAAYYIWGGKSVARDSAASQPAAVSQASTSDDVASIEADLSAVDAGPDLSSLNSL